MFSSTTPVSDPALAVDDSRAEALEQAIDHARLVVHAGHLAPSADDVVTAAQKFYGFLTGAANN